MTIYVNKAQYYSSTTQFSDARLRGHDEYGYFAKLDMLITG